MRWRIAVCYLFGVVLCGTSTVGQEIAVPLKDTGNGLRIEGPERIDPRYGEDYDVHGLATEDLGKAKIIVWPEEGVRIKTGRPWGDGAPYLTFRANLPGLYRLWVIVDHHPREEGEQTLGSRTKAVVHVPDEWAHFTIEVGDPPPPPNPPKLSMGNAEVEEAAGEATLTIALDKPAPADVAFTYATRNGTAVSGADYQSTTGEGSIRIGSALFSVPVPIVDDDESEGTEAFTLALSNVRNATVVNSEATVTILDDDKPPVTDLAGVIIHDVEDPDQQSLEWTQIMYGAPINELLGDDRWQPIDADVQTTHQWLQDLMGQVKTEGLTKPHMFLMDWETKEVVHHEPLSQDLAEVTATVKRFMP